MRCDQVAPTAGAVSHDETLEDFNPVFGVRWHALIDATHSAIANMIQPPPCATAVCALVWLTVRRKGESAPAWRLTAWLLCSLSLCCTSSAVFTHIGAFLPEWPTTKNGQCKSRNGTMLSQKHERKKDRMSDARLITTRLDLASNFNGAAVGSGNERGSHQKRAETTEGSK